MVKSLLKYTYLLKIITSLVGLQMINYFKLWIVQFIPTILIHVAHLNAHSFVQTVVDEVDCLAGVVLNVA